MTSEQEWYENRNWNDDAQLKAIIKARLSADDPVDAIYHFVIQQHKIGFSSGRRLVQGKITAALGIRGN